MSSPKSMPVTIPASFVHRKFSELIRRAFSGKEHFIVERDGLPVVAILSMPEYETLMKEREEHGRQKEKRVKQFQEAVRSIGEEIEQQGLTEEELDAKVEEVRQRLYEEHYGQQPAE